MITLTINVQIKEKNKLVSHKRMIKMFNSMDKAREFITPIVSEMRAAKKANRKPKEEIVACSYDGDDERKMLLKLGALTSIDNESE